MYGEWAGNPTGRPEDFSRCIVEVITYTGNWPHFHQCSFKRKYGPNGEYCKKHIPNEDHKDFSEAGTRANSSGS